MPLDLKIVYDRAAESGGPTRDLILEQTGTYKDAVQDDTDVEAKTAYANLPKVVNPSPFSIGSVGQK
jgi:hypothetical protein